MPDRRYAVRARAAALLGPGGKCSGVAWPSGICAASPRTMPGEARRAVRSTQHHRLAHSGGIGDVPVKRCVA